MKFAAAGANAASNTSASPPAGLDCDRKVGRDASVHRLSSNLGIHVPRQIQRDASVDRAVIERLAPLRGAECRLDRAIHALGHRYPARCYADPAVDAVGLDVALE